MDAHARGSAAAAWEHRAMSTKTEWVYKGPSRPGQAPAGDDGAGWVLFAGIMLALAGILNVIYGIAAISKSHFFTDNAHFIISSLKTWGWVGVLLGATQLLAASSIWRGGSFGRWFGIGAAALSAVAALMSIAGYPFLSLTLFALDVMVIYGLATYGGRGQPM
jgi:hypothetical protein